MKLTVDCVWCSSRRDFLKFLRTTDTYEVVVDYYAIANKLAKTDPSGAEPADTVVGLHLVKAIEDAATKNHKDVLYTIKNLNHSTVEAIIEIFQDKYETEDITVNLIIVNREDYPKKGVLSLFKSVKFIDNL
jgi:hypothetical protein